MTKEYFPNWNDIDEHNLQMELADYETSLLRIKYLDTLQRSLNQQLCKQYPFCFLNKKIRTMGIEGSFFQGDAHESIHGVDGGTFILELTFLKLEETKETDVNTWIGKGEYHKKIFFFPNYDINDVKEYFDSI